MKFLFCGGLSLPEWFLSQLNLLSNLSCVKLRKISNLYVTSLTDAEQKDSSLEQILEILMAGEFSKAECQTIVAMVDFILANAAKNNIESDVLLKELIDLGIPKENCQSLCKILEANLEKLRSTFKQQSLRLNQFDSISVKKWNILKSSEGNKKNQEAQEYFCVDLKVTDSKLAEQPPRINFCMDKPQMTRFVDEMNSVMKLLGSRRE